MISPNLTEAIAFSAPIVCALACMVMMLMNAGVHKRNSQEKRLRYFLALTYLVTSLGWLGMLFYSISPNVFAAYHTVFLLTLMLDQVMIFRFVSIITGTGEQRRFNRLHLMMPLFFTAVSLISDFTFSIDQQTILIYSGRIESGSNMWFRMIYALTLIIFIVYNTLYPLLNLRNIRRYRKFVVNYSSDAYHTSLRWLFTVQVLILITVPLPFAGLLMGLSPEMSNFLAWLGAVPYFINYLILCYNLLNDNYLVIQPENSKENTLARNTAIDRKQFERYLRENKPYLNPNLRITDLAALLSTNRTYLSGFINKEYDMNFCRFINRYRLQELDRLRLLPSGVTKSNIDLVLAAGFSNYRSYLRVKNEEDSLTLLKVFE